MAGLALNGRNQPSIPSIHLLFQANSRIDSERVVRVAGIFSLISLHSYALLYSYTVSLKSDGCARSRSLTFSGLFPGFPSLAWLPSSSLSWIGVK